MSRCPYGASSECLFSHSPESECHFWSPLKKTCIMSSRYEEDEAEEVYWLYKMRKAKMAETQRQTYEGFLEDIERMKALEDGWLDGEGSRISEEAVNLVEMKVSACFAKRPPHIFPTPEGGLSLEWDTKEELDAEVGPSLNGIMIWKDKAERKDWTKEESWIELESHWREATGQEGEDGHSAFNQA